MVKEPLICPINKDNKDCVEERCAWWNVMYGKCVVMNFGNDYSKIRNILRDTVIDWKRNK